MRKHIWDDKYELNEDERPPVRNNQNHNRIPEELRKSVKFCCWFYAWSEKQQKKIKIPVTPSKSSWTKGSWAKVNDPKTFESYDAAEKYYQTFKKENGQPKYDGIGIRVSDGYVGLDFDDCIKDGVIDPDVVNQIDYFNSYTEVSPSGKGIRIICKTKDFHFTSKEYEAKYYKSHPLKNTEYKFHREIYIPDVTNRYCSLTGNTLNVATNGMFPDYPLAERTAEVLEFLEKYMRLPKKESATKNTTPYIPVPEDELTNEQIIYFIKNKGSEKIRRLWDGDYSDCIHEEGEKAGLPDHSAGDYDLCWAIAFYAKDKEQIDEVFRESGMYRDIWDNDHYRNLTLDNVISDREEDKAEHYSKAYRSEQDSVESSFGDMVYTDIIDRSGTDTGSENSATETLDELKERLLRQSNFFAFDKFEEQVKDPDNVPWPTGLYDLDEKLGGGIFPEFMVIGAPPSMGKSALVEQIADTFARDGHDVFYYSFEMAREQLMARSISRIAYLEDLRRHGNHKLSKDFRSVYCGYLRKDFTDEERELISWAEKEYQENYARHLYVFDRSTSTIEKIEKDIEEWRKAFNTVPTIVVDYLQIAPYKNDLKLSTDKMVLDYVTGILQQIQRKYKNRVILISSLNREGSSKQEMQSFSGSSGIEYSADSLLILYDWKTASDEREKKISDQTKDLYENCKKHGYAYGMRIALLKQRFGIKGVSADIAANLKYSCFMDSCEDDKPSEVKSLEWMKTIE